MIPEFTLFTCRYKDGSEMLKIVVDTKERIIKILQGEDYINIGFNDYPIILDAFEAAFEVVEQAIDHEHEAREPLPDSD